MRFRFYQNAEMFFLHLEARAHQMSLVMRRRYLTRRSPRT